MNNQGDMVEAFGESGKLFGFITVENLKAANAITLFGDDNTGHANGIVDGETDLDVSTFDPGVYFLEINISKSV